MVSIGIPYLFARRVESGLIRWIEQIWSGGILACFRGRGISRREREVEVCSFSFCDCYGGVPGWLALSHIVLEDGKEFCYIVASTRSARGGNSSEAFDCNSTITEFGGEMEDVNVHAGDEALKNAL